MTDGEALSAGFGESRMDRRNHMKSYCALVLLLMLFFARASAAAQEVNTVHVGNPQNAAALGKQVQQAYQNGARMIMINPGIYHLPAIGRPTFNLEGWKNATISAYHVTLVMRVKNAGNCFELAHCRNVRIEGPLISQTQLTFYQGRVMSAGYIYPMGEKLRY
jgi:hypothetical protein